MPGGFSLVGHFEHGLVEIGIELLAHRFNAADAVALEHIQQFALGDFNAGDQVLFNFAGTSRSSSGRACRARLRLSATLKRSRAKFEAA